MQLCYLVFHSKAPHLKCSLHLTRSSAFSSFHLFSILCSPPSPPFICLVEFSLFHVLRSTSFSQKRYKPPLYISLAFVSSDAWSVFGVQIFCVCKKALLLLAFWKRALICCMILLILSCHSLLPLCEKACFLFCSDVQNNIIYANANRGFETWKLCFYLAPYNMVILFYAWVLDNRTSVMVSMNNKL